MPVSFQINRSKLKIKSTEFTVVVLKQKDINIIVREELGHILLVDAADCDEMYLLASLFRHSMESNDFIFLNVKTIQKQIYLYSTGLLIH